MRWILLVTALLGCNALAQVADDKDADSVPVPVTINLVSGFHGIILELISPPPYTHTSRPAKQIRFMIGLSILKHEDYNSSVQDTCGWLDKGHAQ